MTEQLQEHNLEDLYRAVLCLQTEEECEKFFADLCTVNELKSISQRVVVARMLKDKSVYSDIVAATGASTATISRVNRALHYGEGGYELVLDRLGEENGAD